MQEPVESHTNSSVSAPIPYYISETKSDMRGIKPGWYAIEDDTARSILDLFPASRNASRESLSLPTGRWRLKSQRGGTEARLYRHPTLGRRRESTQNRPLKD